MKTRSKALLLSLCAVLLVAASVLGTMAYLTDTQVVTNTFTVGAVAITLDETDVNEYGVEESEDRVSANSYKLIPGHTYIKDPTVTVNAGSEDAYVRMIVTVENIDQLKQALPNSDNTTKYYGTDNTFLLQMLCGGWNPDIWQYEGYNESSDVKTGNYEFRYYQAVAKSSNATVLDDLFETITVPGEIDKDHITYLKDVKIVVNAHAIQADGFANADEAWEAFK